MDFGPDTATFLIILLMGTACAYFIGVAMDGVMQADGFGVHLNTIILLAGGFLGYHLSQRIHLPFTTTTYQAVMVVSGGFLSLALLAVVKAIGRRLGF